jgi:hypothetical protein
LYKRGQVLFVWVEWGQRRGVGRRTRSTPVHAPGARQHLGEGQERAQMHAGTSTSTPQRAKPLRGSRCGGRQLGIGPAGAPKHGLGTGEGDTL